MCQSLRELQGRLSSWDNPYKAHMLLFSHLPFLRAGLLTQKWETKVQGSAVHLKAEILIALHRRKVSNWPLSIPISLFGPLCSFFANPKSFCFSPIYFCFSGKLLHAFRKSTQKGPASPKKGPKRFYALGLVHSSI